MTNQKWSEFTRRAGGGAGGAVGRGERAAKHAKRGRPGCFCGGERRVRRRLPHVGVLPGRAASAGVRISSVLC